MQKMFTLFLFFISTALFSQNRVPQTYAVVVGIANYSSDDIPKLRFSNRDAQEFASYLRSKAGGEVPKENIKLLTDENATTAAVYEALKWLKEVCRENDLVYFYFAGHGDMENVTIYKLGFLLTYNTPSTNYINNSLRIEDLNNFANTLSIENKAKVVMITDACHSGKLTGNDYRGNFLVGNQLRAVTANEVRITSCGPDQLALEDEAWGGGRGVFSFYFINGLIGFAADGKDGVVKMKNIRRYLDSSLANDPVLKSNNKIQNPVLKGPDQFQLSWVDTIKMNLAIQRRSNMVMMPAPVVQSVTDMSPDEMMDHIYRELITARIDTWMDFRALDQIPASKIPEAFLKMYKQKLIKDTSNDLLKKNERVAVQNNISQLTRLLEIIPADSSYVNAIKSKIVMLVHTVTQNVINAYLQGDASELERRRYYNAALNGYDIYPVMFSVAVKLTAPDDYIRRILEINKYYFGGVALLLKVPLTENPAPLINEALALELKALELETNAAYIYNAIGVLYYYKAALAKAEPYFLKAAELSPKWILPKNNLLGLYILKKQFDKAKVFFEQVKELKPDFADIYTNAGWMNELQNNYLSAEELQRKSISLNSRPFLPFERLGTVYMKTTNYALADSFYYEADIRKRGFHLKPFKWSLVAAPFVEAYSPKYFCPFDSLTINKSDVLGYFAWGMFYYERRDYVNAEIKWKHVIELDTANPLVFHYLGKMLYKQKRWLETDLLLNFAVKYYADTAALKSHASKLKQFSGSGDGDCFYSTFLQCFYKQTEDHYFLASMYEQWNHFTEAEYHYRKLIALTPGFIGPYKKLWTMLEGLGRYTDAEEILLNYRQLNKADGDNELNAFYKRVTLQLPGDGYWYLKAGQFLYHFAVNASKEFTSDKKAIFPDEKKPQKVMLPKMITPELPAPVSLPGTEEDVYFSSEIITPYSDGISYLLKADSLLGANEELSADVNDKLGDLYMWQGVPAYAAVHYQKSVDLLPKNSGVRLKLIDVYDGLYQFSNAMVHLDSLNKKNELNFEKQVLLAKYFIHMSDFAKAKNELDSAASAYPYKLPRLLDLYGRLYLLSNHSQKAIDYYSSYLKLRPKDSSVMYSISRIYAQMKNNIKAFEWLQKALNNGFNYSWVLKFDPLMDDLRNSSKWNKMMADVVFKIYPPPANTYPRDDK